MTRSETRVLFSMLDSDHDKIISKNDIEAYFANPDNLSKKPVKEVWIEEAPRVNIELLFNKITTFIQKSNTNLTELFKMNDKEKNSIVGFEIFLKGMS